MLSQRAIQCNANVLSYGIKLEFWVKADWLDFASCSGKLSRKMIINWYSQADAIVNKGSP